MNKIDHYAEALRALKGSGDGRNFATDASANAIAHGLLALVDAQREANKQARIANLIDYVTHADGLAQGHKEWLEEEMGL